MYVENADVFVSHNSGFFFVRLNPNGRLGHLVHYGWAGDPNKGWLFGNSNEYDFVEDQILFGILAGSEEAWKRTKNLLESKGVTVAHINEFVPFSRGQHRRERSETDLICKHFVEFLFEVMNMPDQK